MADLMQFNQNSNDSSNFTSAFVNTNMNAAVANLKKRKLLPEGIEDLSLPASKHKCFETVVDSEYESSSVTAMVTEDSGADISSVIGPQVESTLDSNSCHGDTQSGYVDANDEASTAWDNSGSGSLRIGSVDVETSSLRDSKDGKKDERLDEDTCWRDIDGLEECISGQTTERLHEFLSSSGVDPSVFALPSGICGEEETQPGRPKPTIDQEFEQYFSTLML